MLISPKGATTTDLYEVAESEGHAITVVGVVIVGVARTVHNAEKGGVAGTRRPLPPPIPLTVLRALAILVVFLAIQSYQ